MTDTILAIATDGGRKLELGNVGEVPATELAHEPESRLTAKQQRALAMLRALAPCPIIHDTWELPDGHPHQRPADGAPATSGARPRKPAAR